MGAKQTIKAFYRGLGERVGPDLAVAVIRMAILISATGYFYSDFFALRAATPEKVYYARIAVTVGLAISTALIVSVLLVQKPSGARRVAGLTHDIAAVATALFLGEQAAAPLAFVYLWVIIGTGFRFGTRLMWLATVAALVSFALVYAFSPFWRSAATLSFNITMLLVMVPPYLGALLASLNRTKADLRRQATTDVLTGVLNRSSLDGVIQERIEAQPGVHAMLFCDLDRFKAVNDAAGHAAGDRVLCDVADLLRAAMRSDDLVARLGGDEFCVFLPHCNVSSARAVAERIRAAVDDYALDWQGQRYCVGISVGVAVGAKGTTVRRLMRYADAAVYAAKNAGRNRVRVVDLTDEFVDTASIRASVEADDSARVDNAGVATVTASTSKIAAH